MAERNKNYDQDKKYLLETGMEDLIEELDMMYAIHHPKDYKEQSIREDDVVIQMEYAYTWAKRRCYAVRRKVGAILYKDGRAISSGFNGTKRGYPNVSDDSPPYNKLLKARVLFT
jgi:hypothetical protein